MDQFRGRVPPKHYHGDVGAVPGFCLVEVTDDRDSVRCCLERHNAAGHGDFLGRVLLFV